jgi:6-phosphogluconolactonase
VGRAALIPPFPSGRILRIVSAAMLERKIKVSPTPEVLAGEAARYLVQAAQQAVDLSGKFTLALSGGSTPRALYELLAGPAYAGMVKWDVVEVYFSDERCVPPDHADSNFRMANEVLLDRVDLRPEHIHRIRGEIDPTEAAIEYGRMLKARFGDGGVDLALLGMGDDGHTASLFPGTAVLGEKEHRCAPVFVEKLKSWRVTMTAPFLNRSHEVVVLVTGEKKAGRVAEILEGDPDATTYPIQLVRPASGRMLWMMDAAAAGM